MGRLTIIILLITLSQFVKGQSYVLQENIKVTHAGNKLPFPWAGGLNSPMLCGADINNDGLEDIFIFDKVGKQKLVFINVGTPGNYTYALQNKYAANFPDVEGWVRMADYNCDGIKDFFTYNNGGSIRVYKGFYTPDNMLSFVQTYEELIYPSGGYNINLYNSFVDRASLVDVNMDGDLDILTFDVDATRILYYENQRVEDGLPCDSLRYKIADRCWGNIYESGLGALVELKDTCAGKFLRMSSPLGTENIAHVGSSISAADFDHDGDIDILLGDISFSFINLLYNDGSSSYASVLRQDTVFPPSKPLRLNSFPTSSLIDVNGDGKKDLLFTPFSASFADNVKNVRLYSGTNSGFEYTQDDFLVGGMIDVGEGSAAAFYDFNGDGKIDMLVGNAGERFTPDNGATITIDGIKALYNDSPSGTTSFNYDTDYILTTLLSGLKEITIESADIDGDNDQDLLIGESTGRVYWLERICNGSSPSCFVNRGPLKDGSGTAIDVGLNAVPTVADLNRDNKPDLLIGERNGNLNYYRNISVGSDIKFELVTDSLGKIRTGVTTSPGYSAPDVNDFDGDGKWDLLLGTLDKGLLFYSNIEDRLTETLFPSAAIISDLIGLRTIPNSGDINGDGKPEIVVGNFRGGIQIYSMDLPSPVIAHVPIENTLIIYPNPTGNKTRISLPGGEIIKENSLVLYNLLGKRIPVNYINEGHSITLLLSDIPTGIYFVNLETNHGYFSGKVVRK